MTDKQVIIDGVDVSGCGGYYFSPTNFHSCQDIQQVNNLGYEQDTLCEQNPNCHYKQLKRKEKSEEKLVKQIQTICDFINNRPETFKGINGSVDKIITDYAERKEQECDMWKNLTVDNGAVALKYQQQLDQLKSKNKHLNDLLNQALKELEKTRETLTEIKEIVGIGLVDGLQPEEYSGFLKILQAQILQKISEVEDDR